MPDDRWRSRRTLDRHSHRLPIQPRGLPGLRTRQRPAWRRRWTRPSSCRVERQQRRAPGRPLLLHVQPRQSAGTRRCLGSTSGATGPASGTACRPPRFGGNLWSCQSERSPSMTAAIWHGGPRLMTGSVGSASTCFPPSDSGSDWWVGQMVWTTARTTCSNGAFPRSDGLATWSRVATRSPGTRQTSAPMRVDGPPPEGRRRLWSDAERHVNLQN